MGIENQDRTDNTIQTTPENHENHDINIEENENPNVDDAEYTGMENNISNIENFISNINDEIANIDNENVRTKLENKMEEIRQILSKTENKTNTEINREIINNMTNVYNIIDQYYNKLDIPPTSGNEKIQGRINALLDPNITIEKILQINEEIKNNEDKILLLLTLNGQGLEDKDMLILASLLGFECGEFLLQPTEGEEVKLPYISYIPNGYVIIINGEIYYGINEEMAILNYTKKDKSIASPYTHRLNTNKPKETKEGENPNLYDPNWHEIGHQFLFKKNIFGLTFTGYEKNKMQGNSGGMKLKSGVGFKLSSTGNLGTFGREPVTYTVYAGMYQNLLTSTGGSLHIETGRNITAGVSVTRNNMSAGLGLEASNDGKRKYTSDFSRQVSNTVSLGANASYETGGSNPAGFTAGVGANIKL